MILPPFFGLLYKRSETDIQQIINSYLTADIITYTIQHPKLNISYIVSDILSYKKAFPYVNITYQTADIVSYNAPKPKCNLSYSTCDVLTYELPPTVPGNIPLIISREKDSLGILNWIAPYNGKRAILDYIIQYQSNNDLIWTTYYEGINTNTGINIPLTNNETYTIRIAAVNSVGTGNFTESHPIVPSGGMDNPCDLLFFADMDQSDPNQITDYSCYINSIDVVTDNVLFDNNDGAYNSSWKYNGVLDSAYSPHTYPHMRIANNNYNWSISGNFTINLWIKPASISSNTNNTIISSCSESGLNSDSWKLYQYNDNIYFNMNNINLVQATGIFLPLNTYTNIVVCRSNNYLSLFINGIEQNEIYCDTNTDIKSYYLIIGANHNPEYYLDISNGRGYTTDGFNGNIDEIVFSRSCFYRGNFTPIKKSTFIDCGSC